MKRQPFGTDTYRACVFLLAAGAGAAWTDVASSQDKPAHGNAQGGTKAAPATTVQRPAPSGTPTPRTNAAAASRNPGAASNPTAEGLYSADPAKVAQALDALGKQRSAQAAQKLGARVKDGLTPDLLDKAMDALAANGQRDAVRVVTDLARHRRPPVRSKALQILTAMKAPSAEATLATALDDSNADVRKTAAISLGEIKPRRSMDALMAAMARGVPEAATVVGEHASAAQIGNLLKNLDATQFDVVAPALQTAAARKTLSKGTKLAIVEKVAALDTPKVQPFLMELASKNAREPVGQAAVAALERRQQTDGRGTATGPNANSQSAGTATPPAPAASAATPGARPTQPKGQE